jgi:hypothetical protein
MTWLAGGDTHEHGTWKHDLPKVMRHKVVNIVGQRKAPSSPVLVTQDGSARLAALHDQLHAQRNGIYNAETAPRGEG